MNSLILCKNAGKLLMSKLTTVPVVTANRFHENEIIDPPDNLELAHLNYEKRRNDPVDIKKARLTYQSRKRGMLENGILLRSFADKFLSKMTETQLDEYDKIINLPSNDWDIFYWAMKMKPTPKEFDNSVMDMLKNHVSNIKQETSNVEWN